MDRITVRQLLMMLNVVFALLLSGCKIPLENGGIKAGLKGKANSEKSFSINLTEHTHALMVQASGSENVALQIFDANAQSLPVCPEPTRCFSNYLSPGKYTVKMSAIAAYANVSVSAAWAGANIRSLNNNVARALPAGGANTVGLNTFNLPNGYLPVKAYLTGADADKITLGVLNENGEEIFSCPNATECTIAGLDAGTYFLRHIASESYTDISVKLVWGGAESATMQNGVPLTNISGVRDSVVWQSFYIPANTDAFMLQGSQAHSGFIIEIFDDKGQRITSCSGDYPCSHVNPAEGLYSVAIRFYENVGGMSIVAAWGGQNVATISNGVPKTDLSGVVDQILLQSFYIPAGVEGVAVQVSGLYYGLWAEVLDREGRQVNVCAGNNACIVSAPTPGVYFVRIRFNENRSNISVSAAWAGRSVSTLQNGVPRTGIWGQTGQQVLHSLYIPENIDGMAVQLSGFDQGLAEIIDQSGSNVAACDSYRACLLRTPQPGVYFVRLRFNENRSNVSISAAWGGPSISTLQNGVPRTGIVGQQDHRVMLSIYIPENVAYLALHLSGLESGMAEILDAEGRAVAGCNSYNTCIVNRPSQGVYFVNMLFFENRSNVRVSAAWAGPSISTLQNGVPLTGLSGQTGQRVLHSLYIPSGVETMALQVSGLGRGMVEILDASGRVVESCPSDFPCAVQTPNAESVYFARVWFDENASDVTLSAAWAGPSISALQNGGVKAGITGKSGQRLLQSIYIPEDVERLALQLSNLERGMVEILNQEGHVLTGCSYGGTCVVNNPASGAYFLRVWFDEDKTGVSLSATWAGPTVMTLQSGVPRTGISGQAGQQQLQSLYIPEGVTQFALQLTNLNRGFAEILNRDGWVMGSCFGSEPCLIQGVHPGSYFVKLRFDDAQSNVGLLATW